MYKIKAPAFPEHLTWLNSDRAYKLDELRGQVVVLDFWTYCCINCIHVLTELHTLEAEFVKKPVAFIGIHSAKFDNENKPESIQSAIERYQVSHPVVIDSNHKVWQDYAVRAWPTLVIIDASGSIRWHGSGEGHEAEIRRIVQQLLLEAKRLKILSPEPLITQSTPPTSHSTLRFPGKVLYVPEGNRLFISDTGHHRVLETHCLNPPHAQLTTVIGNGQPGFKNGPASRAQLNAPQGLAYQNGYLYIADTGNHAIRQVWVGRSSQNKDQQPSLVSTLAGTGTQAARQHIPGTPLKTPLNSPWDLVINDQTLWIAMAGAHQIWMYDFGTDTIQPWAGTGGEDLVDGSKDTAWFAQPSGLCLNDEYLFIADSETSSIRVINLRTNQVDTMIGQGLFEFGFRDGPWSEALLQHPLGLAVFHDEVWVTDTYNHAIRAINLHQETIRTVVRSLNASVCQINDQKCETLSLSEPSGITFSTTSAFIADTNNHLIRVLDPDKQTLTDLKITTNLVAQTS